MGYIMLHLSLYCSGLPRVPIVIQRRGLIIIHISLTIFVTKTERKMFSLCPLCLIIFYNIIINQKFIIILCWEHLRYSLLATLK